MVAKIDFRTRRRPSARTAAPAQPNVVTVWMKIERSSTSRADLQREGELLDLARDERCVARESGHRRRGRRADLGPAGGRQVSRLVIPNMYVDDVIEALTCWTATTR